MAIIFVDNKKYCVNQSDNLLHACLSLGIDIPYFCWHPVLGSLGACRQCAVTKYKDSQDTVGQLVMSCMTPAVHGTIISINDSTSKNFRKNIIELLMTNHPHDCPICEEGGSCHLQDMTVMTGHTIRRYRFSKRTHQNQYLGPFIAHEMNRCISCYRCVRYYKDYSDGTDFGVFGISNNVYFGRIDDGRLKSEFSGNLVEVCPTGVFTDKTYSEEYSRKWDMQYAPSICQHCCVGCNISVGEKYGRIRRVENRYHNNINHYFLCDMGRFSYGYSNLSDRPKYPIYRSKRRMETFKNVDTVLVKIAKKFGKSSKIIGIGSCRATVESNFALQKLVGIENFSVGMLQKEYDCLMLIQNILKNGGINVPSLQEIENFDTVFILGEDITQTSPLISLSVRQSMKRRCQTVSSSKNIPEWHSVAINNNSKNNLNNNKGRLFIAGIDSSSLDDIADEVFYASVSDQISLSLKVYECIRDNFSNSDFLSQKNLASCAERIAIALILSKRPLIISGSHSYNLNLIKISFNIAKLLKKIGKEVGLILLSPNVNTIGVGLLGGLSIEKVIDKVLSEKIDKIIILENDLYRYLPESVIQTLFKLSTCTIVIDHLNTRTLREADIVIPACNSFENSGTVINYEGRAQRFFQVHDPKFYNKSECVLEGWRWLHFLYCKLHKKNVYWFSLDDVINDISCSHSDFKLLKDVAPDASFRIFGQKLARSPHRISGRTALYSDINVHEPGQPKDVDTMFSFSMEGYQNIKHYSPYVPFSWSPGWNSVQAWNKHKKVINGNYGKILFKESKKNLLSYYELENFDFKKTRNFYLITPYYILFCNNELAQKSTVVKKNMLSPIGIINKLDAEKLSIESDSTIQFSCLNKIFQIKVRLSTKFSQGQLGLPLGIPGFPFVLVGHKIQELWKIIK